TNKQNGGGFVIYNERTSQNRGRDKRVRQPSKRMLLYSQDTDSEMTLSVLDRMTLYSQQQY
ncbi:hypothetical protein DPMN_177282, partial [Dreissena polymorpha]